MSATFKGGWNAGAQIWDENFGYDPSIYANYRLLDGNGDLLPFDPPKRIPNRDYFFYVNTPDLRGVRVNYNMSWGRDENFPEWASGTFFYIQGSVDLRPTNQLRLNVGYNHTEVHRPTDGSTVTRQIVPRARLEYQLSRDLRLRVVSQYAMDMRDSLRDVGRSELPIVFLRPGGSYTRAAAYRDANLRTDFLASWSPNPGTVVYLGYGDTRASDDPDGREALRRANDSFFMKLSYLWRVKG